MAARRARAGSLSQIDTIVMLMLENRSLDTMLGWAHRDGLPINIWPPGSLPARFDGIPSNALNDRDGWPYQPTPGFAHLHAQRWRAPRWDPYEGLRNVQIQMYADGDGVVSDPRWGAAKMKGFAVDYPAGDLASFGDVMGAYTKEELPVLYGLAEHFAVSDRWFSPVPTETDPNRAFSLCGTSQGDEYDVPERIFSAPTIFNGLNPTSDGRNPGRDWAIYWQYNGRGAFDPPGNVCFTQGRFEQVIAALADPRSRGQLLPYRSLLDALRNGRDIPSFCYVEPWWGWGVGMPDGTDFWGFQGNDYHPPAWIGPAEWDLNELYEALINSRQWGRMLFIVTFDEHGGTWDHVAPPRAANPDGMIGPDGFRFERMGPRVPTLLISPYVRPRTVFRAPSGSGAAFDHTSIIKTILEWAGTDPAFVRRLGSRVAIAPSFAGVLATTRQISEPPHFEVPLHYRDQGGGKGPHNLPFDATGLTVLDHRAAIAQSTTAAAYLGALEARAEQLPRSEAPGD